MVLGKPDPPHNCRVFDVTISSLQVNCLAGDDGGLTQQFILQVSSRNYFLILKIFDLAYLLIKLYLER